MLFNAYIALVIKHARVVLAGLVVLCLLIGLGIPQFRLDASADSLVIEGDADLEFAREVDTRYGTSEFLFIAYTPRQELFSRPVIEDLRALKNDLMKVERVASVDYILEVPLFKVADAGLRDVADNVMTIGATPDVDLQAAKADLTSNAAYLDVLLNEEGTTTSLIVNFETDVELQELLARRTELRRQQRAGELDAGGRAELAGVEEDYAQRRDRAAQNLHADITEIRGILDEYRDGADIVMGGVPMIADDLISFVRGDLQVFGWVIIAFVIVALSAVFRRVRYVAIPLACGLLVTVCMVGLLGLLDWPVTVISSNFVSLLLIATVSLTIHLIVRYRELQEEQPELPHERRLAQTLRDMSSPSFYTAATTVVAFASLITSPIPPIIDFGWMMFIGISVSFVLAFLLFPSWMALLKPLHEKPESGMDITPAVGRFTERRGRYIVVASAAMLVFAVLGIQKLRVENSFIEYFDESTDIYQGMVTIDRELGGTTPLDVIIDLTPPNAPGGDGGFDEGEFDFGDEDEEDSDAAWFTSDKMDRIVAIHEWLDALPETGKVLSFATMLNLAYELNDGDKLSSFELGVLYNRIPPDYKETLLRPYVSVEENQLRFSIRVRETDPDLVRSELLEKIRAGLVSEFGFEPEQVHLTGMLVLYNNMLQSLFDSQIMTLGLSLLVTFLMFVVLFRSVSLALIGNVPTLIATLAVLGLMGWLEIPLDMMTITIAAISVGIGVDNSIYYMHRFKESFPAIGNYRATMHYCHGSVGKGIYYTNFTIIAGFSVLVLSNFVPTIYFGLLTSLAMVLSLAGALTLLPQLLIMFKPLGPEHEATAVG